MGIERIADEEKAIKERHYRNDQKISGRTIIATSIGIIVLTTGIIKKEHYGIPSAEGLYKDHVDEKHRTSPSPSERLMNPLKNAEILGKIGGAVLIGSASYYVGASLLNNRKRNFELRRLNERD